jgi:hypothetical protein
MANKLIVCGCSYSDRTFVDRCYGDYLSEMLDKQYVHLAKKGASNDRAWRKATEMILRGQIDSDDILLVQYTDLNRREFPSNNLKSAHVGTEVVESMSDMHKSYAVSDYKIDSYTWMDDAYDAELHQAYQNCSTYTGFDEDYARFRHSQFEALCKLHGITLVVLVVRYICYQHDSFVQFLESSDNIYTISEKQFTELHGDNRKDYELGYAKARQYLGRLRHTKSKNDARKIIDQLNTDHWDNAHLSKAGHQCVAKHLAEYLCNHQLV